MRLNVPLFDYSKKPKILYVADVANWSFDIKINQYKKHLSQFDIDVGYLIPPNPDSDWLKMIERCKYDVIWHQHHKGLNHSIANDFVNHHNKLGTQVICTINEVLPANSIKSELKLLSSYNFLSVNNPWSYESFTEAGFDVYKTYDGVDLNTFGCDRPFQKREFKIFFSASKTRLEQKGYYLLQEVKTILKNYSDIKFVEVITDSYNNKRTQVEMNDIYNECQVFVCLSVSEGGPCTLLESAACGLVPIMTKVGYADYFKTAIVIDRKPSDCAESILYLRNNPELLFKKSCEISQEILNWSDHLMSKDWGLFLQMAIMKSKGIKI